MTNEEKALYFVLMEALDGVIRKEKKACVWEEAGHKIAFITCDGEGWIFVKIYDANYKNVIKEALGKKCTEWLRETVLVLSAYAYIDTSIRAMQALNMH